jgi:hypothetical protein
MKLVLHIRQQGNDHRHIEIDDEEGYPQHKYDEHDLPSPG